jgi:hypothetical protein
MELLASSKSFHKRALCEVKKENFGFAIKILSFLRKHFQFSKSAWNSDEKIGSRRGLCSNKFNRILDAVSHCSAERFSSSSFYAKKNISEGKRSSRE